MKKDNQFFYQIIIGIIILYSACTSRSSVKYSKVNHRSTFTIDSSLYLERYTLPIEGMMTTASISCYITDSVHFRKFITTIDEYEKIIWKIRKPNEITFYLITSHRELPGNSIRRNTTTFEEVLDRERKLLDNSTWLDTTEIVSYNIQELIREGKFE